MARPGPRAGQSSFSLVPLIARAAAYIQERTHLVSASAHVVGTRVRNSKGAWVRYTKGDLAYDLKYGWLLQNVSAEPAAKAALIGAGVRYWRHSPQMKVLLCVKSASVVLVVSSLVCLQLQRHLHL